MPNSYLRKRIWLEKTFGEKAAKRLILTHRKDLQFGHILVDDRTRHGADKFQGMFIHYRQKPFENWEILLPYLIQVGQLGSLRNP